METVSKAPSSVSTCVSWLASVRVYRWRSVPFFRLEYGFLNDADTGVDTVHVHLHLAMGVLAVPTLRLCVQGTNGPLLSETVPPLRPADVGGIVG